MTQLSSDVVIIGGGVAGSSLAIALRRSGVAVTVVEKEPAFRDRVRGEATHPWGVRELQRIGVLDLFHEAGAIDLPRWITWRNQREDGVFSWQDADPEAPSELSWPHVDVQNRLIDEAASLGATVIRPASGSATRTADGWSVSAGETTIAARLLVGADGRRSAIAQLLGSTAEPDPTHHMFGGLRIHGHRLDPESAHQAWHDAGFAMIFPQPNANARAYYVCPTETALTMRGADRISRFLEAVRACLPEGSFDDVTPIGPMAFFSNADVPADVVHGTRAILIGDAAGANDPTQGQGASLAFRDVRVAHELLTSESWDEVPAHYAAQRSAYYGICRAHAGWAAPLITETGPAADEARARVAAAREQDPTAAGYAGIFLHGPDGLATDAGTRARFLGETPR